MECLPACPNHNVRANFEALNRVRTCVCGACMLSSRLYSTVCLAFAANMSKSSRTNTTTLCPLHDTKSYFSSEFGHCCTRT